MHPAELPDLAHTRPTPLHWLATATAMAAVVALAGLVQPGDASGSQAQGPPISRAAPSRARHLPPPDPSAVRFPLGCGPVGTVVTARASGDLDGDGVRETVAAVRCDSASGTPPSAIYVLNRTRAGAPRVVATLLSADAGETVGKQFTIKNRAVLATLLGYSDQNVPRCCPDVQDRVSWVWRNKAFVRSEQSSGKSI
ncbi:hypothetical protein [Streptomyces montanisoli]|uniref:Uncharacterized protein n=1 Tax=Streptomyces montanisoli TaxID=2798581 RepID=A0A940MDS9_9ACTN|nr:hypothetical protein [Streptomyces montanisoli]MBP0457261.1 hypothetical protein [Streptomyces montanisoli]